MKSLKTLALATCHLLLAAVAAAQNINVQKAAGTNAITADLVFGNGRTLTIGNGAIETIATGGYIRAHDGGVNTPPYSFTNYIATGFFISGADQIGFTAGGNWRGYFDINGVTALSASLNSVRNAIGVTPTDGLYLTNAQSATAILNQNAPAEHFNGQGWATAAGGSTQTVDWRRELRPQTGTAAPTGLLVDSVQIAGGGYVDAFSVALLTTGGGLQLTAIGDGIALNAGGSGKNITLTPSGTGQLISNINGNKFFHETGGGGAGGVLENVFLGYQAGATFGASSTGAANVGIGSRAMFTLNGTYPDATSNVAIGYKAMQLATTNSFTTAIGVEAMGSAVAISDNTGVGYHAGINTLGAQNTFVGSLTGVGGTSGVATGASNTAMGALAFGKYQSANNTVAIGKSSLENMTTPDNNTAVGTISLRTVTTGANNVGIGYGSGGTTLTTGANNTFLGYLTTTTKADLTNSTAIGNGASVTTDNTMVFGNSSVASQVFNGKVTFYAGVATAGFGFPVLRAAANFPAQVAAVATIATFTPAVDTTIGVSVAVLVTTSSSENFTVQVAYTDTGNTPRTAILPLRLLSGVNTLIINFANGAVPYAGVLEDFRVKGGTAITLSTTGTFTGCTYSVNGSIREISQ